MAPKRQALWAVGVIVMIVAGCHPFRPEPRVAPEGPLSAAYSLQPEAKAGPQRWWETFDAPELNAMVEEALSGSFTLKQAWARLRQAEALAVQAGAGLYPELTAESGTAVARERIENGTSTTRITRDYSLGVSSSYEIDLWGRIRSGREAARLESWATRQDLNAAAITLAAEVTARWINIISQRMQKELLERQLDTNLIFLELVELRFRKSIVSALDVFQQKQVVERVKADIPLVEREDRLLRNELAVLLGRPPQTPLAIQRKSLPAVAAIPPTGLPADLLSDRPDVRAAGMRLDASDWRIAAARADRLPAIRLTGDARYSADDLDLIFDNWLLGLAGVLALPLIDGGRRVAEVDRTRAVAEENLWRYREAVLTAVREVEDALVSEQKQREHIQGLERQAEAARNALEQASERYRKGLNDYLPVLTQLLTVQSLERDLIRQRALLVIDRINLYRALGGSWPEALTAGSGSTAAVDTNAQES